MKNDKGLLGFVTMLISIVGILFLALGLAVIAGGAPVIQTAKSIAMLFGVAGLAMIVLEWAGR